MTFEDEMMEFDTIVLPMEDDTEQEFAILDDFELDGKTYLVVSRIDGEEIEDQIFIYGYTEDEEGLLINYIEDDAEYEAIFNAYMSIVDDFEDEDEE